MEEEFYGSAYKGWKVDPPEKEKGVKTRSFGAAADHYLDKGIDLNSELVRNKPATFFCRMKGDAMRDAGIFDNDLMIVDRSLKLASGKIIVAILNGEVLIRRFHKNFTSAFLIAENSRYKPINLAEFSDFTMSGVVTFVIHEV